MTLVASCKNIAKAGVFVRVKMTLVVFAEMEK